MVVTLNDLTRMSQAELDDLFRRSPTGDIPDGDADGRAMVAPGTKIEEPIVWLAYGLAWRGKVFDRPRAELVNKVGRQGVLHLFKARVYFAPSWFDGQMAIILDYSMASLLPRKVRDEIREVGPGTYLGLVYYAGRKTPVYFALQFAPPGPSSA